MIKKKILVVFGTRPEAIKMAPVVKQLSIYNSQFTVKVCVTAQHRQMLDEVLDIFRIKPDYDLNIMRDGQDLYYITASVLQKMKRVLAEEKPDMVLVHGDTTTTFAAALASFYQRIPVGHVEAGLRSHDKSQPFPEEANRLLTDSLCDLHFAPTSTAKNSLLKENQKPGNIFITGNTVIDALHAVLKMKRPFRNPILKKLSSSFSRLPSSRLILVTAHRRENFGKPLEDIFSALARIAREYPGLKIIYPVHLNPNVQRPAKKILGGVKNVILLPPVDYSDLAGLVKASYLVVTDSGGLQEEAPALGKPVLVLREVTERPEAVKAGTVKIIGSRKNRIYSEIKRLLENEKEHKRMSSSVNPYGDGKAAYRTVEAIRYFFGLRKDKPADFRPS
ncbi:MAG: UDP-N-acetylglucosamine 2-epimerase (non-hydrolyzing) [Elusimicrobiota bacterium]